MQFCANAALRAPSRCPTPGCTVASGREREVLELIAKGSNNAETSGRLFINEKTTKNHVSSILGKLHLADR